MRGASLKMKRSFVTQEAEEAQLLYTVKKLECEDRSTLEAEKHPE